MTIKEIVKKLNQVQLSIYVHPDREPNSEFADCVDTLGEVIADLSARNSFDELVEMLEPVKRKPSGFASRLQNTLEEQKRQQEKRGED